MKKRPLKTGFTTGSAASAAAKAGVFILGGNKISKVDIPTPEGKRLTIPIFKVIKGENFVHVWVKKDGGDDPDVTHGALIGVRVLFNKGRGNSSVEVLGGRGVGLVTKPGLPVGVGHAAINPSPLKQIKSSVLEALEELNIKAKVVVIVEVKNGEYIARKTLNPRLGILGGISILGTRGTVIPYSAEAYMETINLAMDVARTLHIDHIGLTTGGRSERLLKRELSHLPEQSFIQIADYFRFSLESAVKKGFLKVSFGMFFGKLIKMAQGFEYTHAKNTKIDFNLLAKWAEYSGLSKDICEAIKGANTGRHVYEIISKDKKKGPGFVEFLTKKAISVAMAFSHNKLSIDYYVFDPKEKLILKSSEGIS